MEGLSCLLCLQKSAPHQIAPHHRRFCRATSQIGLGSTAVEKPTKTVRRASRFKIYLSLSAKRFLSESIQPICNRPPESPTNGDTRRCTLLFCDPARRMRGVGRWCAFGGYWLPSIQSCCQTLGTTLCSSRSTIILTRMLNRRFCLFGERCGPWHAEELCGLRVENVPK